MEELRIIRLHYGGKTRFLTMWSGCGASEVRELIGAAFGVSIKGPLSPVAIVAEDSGVIVPLSVACAHPKSLDAESYSVMRADGTGGVPAPPPSEAEDEDEGEDGGEVEEKEKMDKVTQLVCKFARLMESQGRLAKLEADTIVALASKKDAVILAAFAVAATDQDAEVLLSLLSRVASDYLNVDENGSTEHAVSEQLLRVIDELYLSKKYSIGVEKCRYLQRLVIEKNPVILAAFDVYADDGDLDELFDTLVRLSQRCPTDSSAKDDDDDEDGRESIEEKRLAVFRDCASWMVEKHVVEKESANALLASAAMGNQDLSEALDEYGRDGDLEAFLETLARVARGLEAQRAPLDERRLVVFKECVSWLLEKEVIAVQGAQRLFEAAVAGDAELRAAIDSYATESSDLGVFLETLATMARNTQVSDSSSTGGVRAAEGLREGDGGIDDDDALREMSELVSCLHGEGKLTHEEVRKVTQLLVEGDVRLLAAYDVYVETQDVEDLVDTIMRIARHKRQQTHQQTSEPDEEEEEGDGYARAPSTAASFRENTLPELARSRLSDVETAALQLCAARNDPDLAAVLQVFRVQGDQEDFEDSLKRIARKTIEETAKECA